MTGASSAYEPVIDSAIRRASTLRPSVDDAMSRARRETDHPALVQYAERMWLRHEEALIATLTEEFGLAAPSAEIRFYARFALQIPLMARQADPESAMDIGFRLLDQGWNHYNPTPR